MIRFATSFTLWTAVQAQVEEIPECVDSIASWLEPTDPLPEYNLEVPCTSLDESTWDTCDCLPTAFVNWDGNDCGRQGNRQCPPETYFNSPEYQLLDGVDKMEQLWTQLIEESPTKVKCQNFNDMWKHFQQDPGPSMVFVGDEMNNGRNNIRQKLVHQQGLVA